MGGRQVLAARQLLAETLAGELPEHEQLAAARAVVAELGSPDRLSELTAELASGEGDPHGCARLSYRHVLGFDKLLLIDDGPHHMLRAHLWHPGRGAIGKEDIHNHRSPLASSVVRGRLAMELYAPRAGAGAGDGADAGAGAGGDGNGDGEGGSNGDGGIGADRYRESLAAGSADWLLEPTGPARLRLTQVAEYAAGSTYALPAHTLHRAWCSAAEPTVTLFLETGNGRRRHTDVFTAAGPHPGTVPKVPLETEDYLSELDALAELLRSS